MRRTSRRGALVLVALLSLLAGCAGEVTVTDGDSPTTGPAAEAPVPGGSAGDPTDGGSSDERPGADTGAGSGTDEGADTGTDEGTDTGADAGADTDGGTDGRGPAGGDVPAPVPTAPPGSGEGSGAREPGSSPTRPSGPRGEPTRPAEQTPSPTPPTGPKDPAPKPSPTPPLANWAALISQARTGPAPAAFGERDRYVSCGDLVRAHGQELLPPEIVACLDDGAAGEGAEAAIAVPTAAGDPLVWFVRRGPGVAEIFLDATRDPDVGGWQYADCDATVSIGHLACEQFGPVPTGPAANGEGTRPGAGEQGTMGA